MPNNYDYLIWMTEADWNGTPDQPVEGQQYSPEVRARLQLETERTLTLQRREIELEMREHRHKLGIGE